MTVRGAGAPRRGAGVGVPGVVPVGVVPVGVVLTGVTGGVTVPPGGVGIATGGVGIATGGGVGLPGLETGTLTGLGARVVG
ncbi:MAG: hypothetical protein ACRDNK_03460 [Solirubrobacteraceae bacterium]